MASPAAVKKVLFPITAGSEPVEAFVPIAVLRRAGADVTVAAAGAGADLRVHAMYGVTVVADVSVADCADESYDLVALPGGVPGADNLGGCAALESIVRRHELGGGPYAAICAAPPLALGRWGLLNGVKVIQAPVLQWWMATRKPLPKVLKQAFDSLVMLMGWMLWKERNNRTFNSVARSPQDLASCILEELSLWTAAGYRKLSVLEAARAVL